MDKPYCNRCGGFHYQSTSACGAWSAPLLGYSFRIPEPEITVTKKMPCGHLGLLIWDKWVCQTCTGWELASIK